MKSIHLFRFHIHGTEYDELIEGVTDITTCQWKEIALDVYDKASYCLLKKEGVFNVCLDCIYYYEERNMNRRMILLGF